MNTQEKCEGRALSVCDVVVSGYDATEQIRFKRQVPLNLTHTIWEEEVAKHMLTF